MSAPFDYFAEMLAYWSPTSEPGSTSTGRSPSPGSTARTAAGMLIEGPQGLGEFNPPERLTTGERDGSPCPRRPGGAEWL